MTRAEETRLIEDVSIIRRHIDGGDKPETGMIVRLDRLEQKDTRRERWTAAAIVAIVANIGMLALVVAKYALSRP